MDSHPGIAEHGHRGFKPTGMRGMLQRCGLAALPNWRINKFLLSFGLLTTDKRKMVEMLTKEAAIVNGIQEVTVVRIAGKRPTYIVGDIDDIVRMWALLPSWHRFDTLTESLYWCAFTETHWYVPFMEIIEEDLKENGTSIVWPRVQQAILVFRTDTSEHNNQVEIPEPFITYCATPTGILTTHAFHIHFVGCQFLCFDEFRMFVSQLDMPRQRVWISDEKTGYAMKETTLPLYNHRAYELIEQGLQGPFCGHDGKTNSFQPWNKEPIAAATAVSNCQLRVPYNRNAIELQFRFKLERSIQQHVIVHESSKDAMLTFWAPFLVRDVIPMWQSYRYDKALALRTVGGASVPTKNLLIHFETFTDNVHTYQVVGDTFCEMSPTHYHDNDSVIRCCLDLHSCSIWQFCNECKQESRKMSFLTQSAFRINKLDDIDSAYIYPPPSNIHSFLLHYFHDMFVSTTLTQTKLVYQESNRIWVDGEAGNTIVNKLVDDVSQRYSEYVTQVYKLRMEHKLEQETKLLIQQNLPEDEYKEKYRQLCKTELESTRKKIKKHGPLVKLSPHMRGRFLLDMRVYASEHVIEDTDQHTHLVPMRNGECYNLYTGTTRKIEKQDYFTSVCNAELSTDPSALNLINSWFLELNVGNDAHALYMKRLAGYLMTMQQHDRKFYVLIGNGKNGKGVFKELVSRVLYGTANAPSRMCVLPHSFWEVQRNNSAENASPMLMNLKDATLYYTDDIPRMPIAVGRLKSLVAHETTSGRQLYGTVVKFRPHGKVLWTTNVYPALPGEDNASWERYVLVPCLCKYVENEVPNPAIYRFAQNRVRMDAILSETDAFFTVAMYALTTYYQTLMKPTDTSPATLAPLPLPDSLIAVRRAARHRELPLARFVDTCMSPDPGSCLLADAFDAYLTFLTKENENAQLKKTTLQVFENLLCGAMDLCVVNGSITGFRLLPYERNVRSRYD